jgi:hypothetical protein
VDEIHTITIHFGAKSDKPIMKGLSTQSRNVPGAKAFKNGRTRFDEESPRPGKQGTFYAVEPRKRRRWWSGYARMALRGLPAFGRPPAGVPGMVWVTFSVTQCAIDIPARAL